MVEIYVKLIRAGKWTLDRVPLTYREEVRRIIEGAE